MKVLQVKKYNQLQEGRYHDATSKWKPANGGFPQAAFYFMSTNYGSFRQTGYVAFSDSRSVWANTKRKAIEDFSK